MNKLADEGLLEKKKLRNIKWGDDAEFVSYESLWNQRFKVLHKAFKRFDAENDTKFIAFCETEAWWLDDYSLYMACKCHFEHKSWLLWEDDLRFRKPETMAKYREMLAEEVTFWKFIQYKFYAQWTELKEYANEKGVKIIGDIPIYVALDSCLLYTSPSPRDRQKSRMPSSA